MEELLIHLVVDFIFRIVAKVFTRGVTYPLIPPWAPLLRDHTQSPIGAGKGKHHYPPIYTFITPTLASSHQIGGSSIKITSVILYKHNLSKRYLGVIKNNE